jgi:hypothetical protein
MANGLPTPTVQVLGNSFKERQVYDALARLRGEDRNARTVRVRTVLVSVDGFTAPIGEWDIVGYRWSQTVKTQDGVMSVFGSSPEVPTEIADRNELVCDHCLAKRNRLSSYVLSKADGTGEPLEVGATCMEAFLGSQFAGALAGLNDNAMLYQEIARAAREDFLLSDEDVADEIDTVLAVASSIIAREGFVPSKEAFEGRPATWKAVYEDVRRYRAPHLDDSDLTVTMSDFMVAAGIIQWAQSDEAGPAHNQFVARFRHVLEKGITNPADIAVLTALVASHNRYLAEASTREHARETKFSSRHVGMIDERSNMIASVLSVVPYQGRYGEGDVVTMSEGGGNLLVWFASNRSHGLQVGSTFEITATVKGHDRSARGEYEGALQTVINRVSVIRDLGPTTLRERAPEDSGEDMEFTRLIGFLAPSPA